MATADDLRRLALALEGTVEVPHFDRAAFRTSRIYATLAPDGLSANLRFSPDDQAFACLLAPDVLKPLPNAWGRQGWTAARLDGLGTDELGRALEKAWHHAGVKGRRR